MTARLPATTYRDIRRAETRSPAEGAAVEVLHAVLAADPGPWPPGKPDRLCTICGGSGKARVRGPGPVQRGLRAVVIWVRVAGINIGASIEATGAARAGDRLVPCPSCIERDEGAAAALEGAVFAVEPRGR